MDKFTTLAGIAAPLPMTNVDTDKIFPAPFLKTVERKGLGKFLFAGLRYRDDGSENPDFVLNQSAYRQAKILVTWENFGCGSSREHAPWALLGFGIRCIIAPSFADIFYGNCLKNGLLPIPLPKEIVSSLLRDAQKGEDARFAVDLANQTITRPDGNVVSFEIDAARKQRLLEGIDDVALTLKDISAIKTFEKESQRSQPWLWS